MRHKTSAAAGAVLLAVLAGCGSGTDASREPDGHGVAEHGVAELSAALDRAQRSAKTATFSYSVEAAPSGNSDPEPMNPGNPNARDAAYVGEHGTGALRLGDPPAMRTTGVDVHGGATRLVSAGGSVYVNTPQDKRSAADRRPWLKMGASTGHSTQVRPTTTLFGDVLDPATIAASIKSAGTVRKSEPGTVDGRPVTHYSIRLKPGKLLGPGKLMDQSEELGSMPSTLPAELDVDRNQLPIKIALSTVTPEYALVRLRAHYTDWGKPVDIQAPASGQYANVDAVLHNERTGGSAPVDSSLRDVEKKLRKQLDELDKEQGHEEQGQEKHRGSGGN
ncbi:hypothetical protein [Sciscionella marina]|uniref:hypothetical protein n=1 Tax=Sciscionella marina TaxID=508770 RepID=UPI0012F6D2C3|nr:hypothetical protein [Sciscionella marina]